MKTVRECVHTFMIILVPLVSLLIHGCALPHMDPDEYDRHCSDGAQWVDCLSDFEAFPTARNEIKQHHSDIRVLQYRPLLHLTIVEQGEPVSRDRIAIPEPFSSVKERFLAAVQAEVRPSHFTVAQDPHPTDRLGYFKQLFGKGLVLDIRSMQWVLMRVPDWSVVLHGTGHYALIYRVRVRLIRAEGPTLLWHYLCRSKGFRTEQKYTLAEWQADDNLLLKVKAEEEAKRCADDLAASLLEQ
ncbi:MAG: hypothetical protein A4C66_02360 [Nitrospira sp. HN-bin3]|uniref:hypothetical protein n=1 Tax=Nitrospira cf. moscoviensis SBR1015 TaxID=96242 RepID=UPI000A09DB59|nr:hypothetical protein [Nitrospira cf. moscoviensis SBR1015]OQW40250.1 MAG: hypothetical protein A4C66_02360 [Nitrospira sp. HN-bin3]